MKKLISCLFVLLLVFSMFGCNTHNEETPILTLESEGTYNIPGFGEEYTVYRFYAPNEQIVVYGLHWGAYLLGDDAGKNGNSYAYVSGVKDYEFLAISDKYWLFEKDGEKVAITFKSRTELGMEINIGDFRNVIYSYEELTQEEQDGFVYWSRRESKKNQWKDAE